MTRRPPWTCSGSNAVVGRHAASSTRRTPESIGIQCALCHSTVDDSVAPGIGHRLDGWANRDLDIGAIVALAPEPPAAVADLLGVDRGDGAGGPRSWGPGKFDAELLLDGKAFRPDGRSAATLIPPAFGLAGVNLHTWTGWGSVTHWNAFVANLEMHGKGTFFDPRLTIRRSSRSRRARVPATCATAPDLITRSSPRCTSTSSRCRRPRRRRGASTRGGRSRGRGVFNGKAPAARPATSRRCSPSRLEHAHAARSASTTSRPIAPRPPLSHDAARGPVDAHRRAASTTTGGSPPWPT